MNKRKLLRAKTSNRPQRQGQTTGAAREVQKMLALAAQALEKRQPALAEEWCRRILALEPARPDALNLLGLAAVQAGNFTSAEESLRNALAAQPNNPAFLCNLGILLANRGRSAEALVSFEKALEIQADNVDVLYNLVELYEKTNQLSLAIEKTGQALALRPGYAPLLFQLAKLEYRTGKHAEARDRITEILRTKPDADLTQKSLHLLGQACDRLGEHQQAFSAFQQANGLLAQSPQARALEPKRREILHFMRRQQGLHSADHLQDWRSAPPPALKPPPVFLVGFPRSGTTLAGQLLAAHSGIITLDERQTLAGLINEFTSPEHLDLLATLPAGTISLHRTRYHELISDLAGPSSKKRQVIDKNPIYLCYLDLIHRIFPEAKVIAVHRDPRDVCLSNFMQDFSLSPFMQNFLTLEHTIEFYDVAMNLFRQLRSKLPLAMLEVRYEDLVGNWREETARILSFLGLAWEERIASFHELAGTRYIQTPSYQQVVQPVYASARGRWLNYATQLAPYLDRLRPHIINLGYEPGQGKH